MPKLPDWALIAMWLATITGTYFLTREMMARFGRGL
jgi:hypothetical protein